MSLFQGLIFFGDLDPGASLHFAPGYYVSLLQSETVRVPNQFMSIQNVNPTVIFVTVE